MENTPNENLLDEEEKLGDILYEGITLGLALVKEIGTTIDPIVLTIGKDKEYTKNKRFYHTEYPDCVNAARKFVDSIADKIDYYAIVHSGTITNSEGVVFDTIFVECAKREKESSYIVAQKYALLENNEVKEHKYVELIATAYNRMNDSKS